MKKRLWFSGIVLFIVLFLWVVYVGAKTSVYQDPILAAYASNLGIDVGNVNLVAVDEIDIATAKGVFLPPNTIQVKAGLDASKTRVVLAHEYLHYVWHTLPEEQRPTPRSTPEVEKLLSNYACNKNCMADERLAFTCVTLPEPNAHCDRYIKNRSILF